MYSSIFQYSVIFFVLARAMRDLYFYSDVLVFETKKTCNQCFATMKNVSWDIKTLCTFFRCIIKYCFSCLLCILVSVDLFQLYLLCSTVYSISSFGRTMGCGVFQDVQIEQWNILYKMNNGNVKTQLEVRIPYIP